MTSSRTDDLATEGLRPVSSQPNIERERVIAEGPSDIEPWLVMFDNGEVRSYANQRSALRGIKRRARYVVADDAILITTIEWRYE